MDCKTFRKHHALFVDEQISGVMAAAMYSHARGCPACAAHDARIRRALLLARNLPRVDVSADFATRLRHRIETEKGRGVTAAETHRRWPRFAAMAVAGLGFLAVFAVRRSAEEMRDPPRLAGVVALPPATLDSTTAPAIVASMSAGMPVWPALWLAERAQFRYASGSDSPTQP